jgi:hypothetical protein
MEGADYPKVFESMPIIGEVCVFRNADSIKLSN